VLDYNELEVLRNRLNDHLEKESIELRSIRLVTQDAVNRHLQMSVLFDLVKKHYAKMYSNEITQTLSLSRSEALALLTQLKDVQSFFLQQLKGGLHQLLS